MGKWVMYYVPSGVKKNINPSFNWVHSQLGFQKGAFNFEKIGAKGNFRFL
jgi:hypothetical protein